MAAPISDHATSSPVLVTGATGYIAGWLVRRLLEQGLHVHATVRDPSNVEKIAYLQKLADELPGSITFFKADLLDEGSFDAAMAGCSIVFHTASPYFVSVADAQRDLVDPAVKGTRNVLNAANSIDSVTRVVLTSSCAAIYGDAQDAANKPDGILTEDDWNTTSTLLHQPYSYSKTQAEKTAWDMAGAQTRWKLVVVNPAGVFGPGVAGAQAGQSFDLVRQLGDGTLKMGAIDFEIGCVDVRDVAQAHVLAGFIPEAEGRHIVSNRTFGFLEMANVLRGKYGDAYPLPKRLLPKWLVWLAGPMIDKAVTRAFVSRNIGHKWLADHRKSEQALGLVYSPVEPGLIEMFQQVIDAGLLRKT